MIWGEKDYRYGLLLATACVILFMFILRWLNVKLAFIKFSKINFLIYVLCAVTCFLGMRGGFRSLPLNMHDANVSEHYFFNQLSMSPVFQIYKTLFDRAQPLNIYDKDVETNACTLAKSYTTEQDSAEEIVHKNKPNVIIILLESMASFKLNQTPFLNSLIQKSIFFDSFYSAGEHTYNGIYSTLTGEPALMQKPMLRYMENASFTGMPEIFKSRGYYNFFQIPHSRYFDNMGKFLWKHHFDSLVDNSNIPSDLQGGSSWGTCDHKYYEFAIRNLNFISHKHKPFFTVLLSISDHQPYFIPSEQNIPKFSGPPSKAIVQYVDWSLKQFFTNAANQSWFNNTVFLILADHGFYTGKPDYPLPLAFHHIPCFIYSKKRENAPQIIHNFGSQQDLLPTLAAYLGFKYKDNPLSVNLFRTKRGFAYFSSDDYAGLLTHNRYSMLGTFGDVKVYNSTGQALPEKEAQADVQKILSLYRYAHYRSDNKRKKK
jgi:phosphoglycerol transferase MdoB-like AlkP superfamily enzyme